MTKLRHKINANTLIETNALLPQPNRHHNPNHHRIDIIWRKLNGEPSLRMPSPFDNIWSGHDLDLWPFDLSIKSHYISLQMQRNCIFEISTVASRPWESARYNSCTSCNQYTSSALLQCCMLTGRPGLRQYNCRPRMQPLSRWYRWCQIEIEYCKSVYELSTYSNVGKLIFGIILSAQLGNTMSVVYSAPFVGLSRLYAAHFYRSFELYELSLIHISEPTRPY